MQQDRGWPLANCLTTMNEQETIQLITKVIAGEASLIEQEQLELWRKQSANHELQYNELLSIWNNAQPNSVDTEKAWANFEQRLTKQPKKISLNNIFRVAAAMLMVSGLGLLLGRYLLAPSIQQIQTAANEVKQVTLPDGSVVWLNQGSLLSFEKKFKGDSRNVTLEGEAFFEVVKNPEKPFVIQSEQSVTKVLGTSFNLNTRNGNNALLSVVTGKVSFASPQTHEEVIVVANQSAVITEQGHALKDDKTDVNAFAWKTNTLSFNDASLEEVFKSMEHYFKLNISVDDKRIYNCHFTGEFVKPTFKQVMDVISKTLQLTYEQKGKQVLVKGKGCE